MVQMHSFDPCTILLKLFFLDLKFYFSYEDTGSDLNENLSVGFFL